MPRDRNGILRRASRYSRQGKLPQAIVEYRRWLEVAPEDWEVHNLLGDVYVRQGASRDACLEYIKAAQAYEAVGAMEMAVALYKKILRLDPGYYRADSALAKIYEDQGYRNEALQQYQKLANYYIDQGLDKEAWETYKKICQLNPEDENARTWKDRLAEKIGKEKEASPPTPAVSPPVTELSLPGEPEFTLGMLRDYYELARIHWESGEIKEALEKGRTALEKNPTDFKSLELLGKIYLQRSQWENALLIWEKLVILDPYNPRNQEIMGDILLARGRKAKAWSYYSTAADLYQKENQEEEWKRIREKISPLEPTFTEQEVEAQRETLKKEIVSPVKEAKESLEKVLEEMQVEAPSGTAEQLTTRGPEEMTVQKVAEKVIPVSGGKLADISGKERLAGWELKVQEFREKGMIEEAIQELQQAVRQGEDSPACWKLLGMCFAEKGMYNQAIRYVVKAREKVYPSSEDYLDLQYNLGSVYEKMGNRRMALKIFQEILSQQKFQDVEKRIEHLQQIISISEVPTSREKLNLSHKDSKKSEPEEKLKKPSEGKGEKKLEKPSEGEEKPGFRVRDRKSKISFV